MTPAPATRTAADGTTHGLLVRSGRPTSSAASGWLLRRSCPQAMFSRNGKRNRARGACTVFPSRPIQSVRKAWRTALDKAGVPYFPIYNLHHVFCTRLSWVAPRCGGAAGDAAQQSGDQASLSTRNGGSGSRGHRTSQRASLPGPRVTTFSLRSDQIRERG